MEERTYYHWRLSGVGAMKSAMGLPGHPLEAYLRAAYPHKKTKLYDPWAQGLPTLDVRENQPTTMHEMQFREANSPKPSREVGSWEIRHSFLMPAQVMWAEITE